MPIREGSLAAGVAPSGLFWTQPISRDNIEINLGLGTARFHMRDVAIGDHQNIVVALEEPPGSPGIP
jgi:hypothetical protein